MKTTDLEKKIRETAVEQLNAEFNAAIEPLTKLVHRDRWITLRIGRNTHRVQLGAVLDGALELYREAHADRREMELLQSMLSVVRDVRKIVTPTRDSDTVFRLLGPKERPRLGDEIYNTTSENWEPVQIITGHPTGCAIRRPVATPIRVPWFRLLNDGEEILPGDEVYNMPNLMAKRWHWVGTSSVGIPIRNDVLSPHRRLMPATAQ